MQDLIDRIVAIVATAVIFALVTLAAMLTPTPARADSPYASWAVVVVAGDWHSHGGGQSEAFDNARRDVTRGLVGLGFLPSHIKQFSSRSQYYEGTQPAHDTDIYRGLRDLSREATGGCLVYLTSHGNRDGIVMSNDLMSPRELSQLLDETCGDRSTVVVVSACFSGVFVPALQSPSRMVLTAARPDRSSFGCGEADKYPYFDACFLHELPGAPDFPSLGRNVQSCVAQRERETGAAPPSEPQLSVGDAIAPTLRAYAFHNAQPQSDRINHMNGACASDANSIARTPC